MSASSIDRILPSEQRAQVADRVRVRGVLVRPVALDAGEAERDAARVAGRGLDAVERDLDDELRTREHRDPLPAGLALEQRRRLPLEQLVGQPLERLPD